MTKEDFIEKYFDPEKGFGLHEVQIALVKNMMQEYADQESNQLQKPVQEIAEEMADDVVDVIKELDDSLDYTNLIDHWTKYFKDKLENKGK